MVPHRTAIVTSDHLEERQAAAPLTDSPWFWAYLFGTAALVALFLAGPRYHGRQGQLEREFSARQAAGQIVVGPDGPVPPSEGPAIISLRPLCAMLAVLWTIAWGGLWYQRFRRSPGRNELDSRRKELTPRRLGAKT
jgi:hypothetical protein